MWLPDVTHFWPFCCALQDALAGMLDGLAGVHIRGAIPQSDVVKLVAKDTGKGKPQA